MKAKFKKGDVVLSGNNILGIVVEVDSSYSLINAIIVTIQIDKWDYLRVFSSNLTLISRGEFEG